MASFYRLCRDWHGYLSAIAFVWLLFFAATGILLNHPAWLKQNVAPTEKSVILAPGELAALKAAKTPAPAAVDLLRGRMGLSGDITSSEVVGTQIFVRLRGARGASDLQLDLTSGKASASVERFAMGTMLEELHRGEQAGPVWRALIDVSGGLLIATSLIGLLIYFSMRLRLATALILMGVGLAAMVGGIVLFVA